MVLTFPECPKVQINYIVCRLFRLASSAWSAHFSFLPGFLWIDRSPFFYCWIIVFVRCAVVCGISVCWRASQLLLVVGSYEKVTVRARVQVYGCGCKCSAHSGKYFSVWLPDRMITLSSLALVDVTLSCQIMEWLGGGFCFLFLFLVDS